MNMTHESLEEFALRHFERIEREGPSCLEAITREHPLEGAQLQRLVAHLARYGLVGVVSEPGFAAGRQFGAYRLKERLGEGGMGAVWLAESSAHAGPIALKMLPAFLIGSDRARERFRREAEILQRFDHPGLCPVIDAGEVDGTPYLAMRKVEGQTLAAFLARRRQADPRPPQPDEVRAAMAIVARIARALHAAHEVGVVHRDVKASNVILDPRGEPIVIDFGLAHAEDIPTLTQSGAVLGTPCSMAPEQVRGQGVDRRTDVYGLGALLYECVTLRPVFEAPSIDALYHEILTRQPESPRKRNRSVSAPLRDVIERALAKETAQRFATAAELAAELERMERGERTLTRRLTAWDRVWRWTRIHRAAAAALAATTCGLAIALVLLCVNLTISRERLATTWALESKITEHDGNPLRAFLLARDGLALSDDAFVVEQAQKTAGELHERMHIRIDAPTNVRRLHVSLDGQRLLAAPESYPPVLIRGDGTKVVLSIDEPSPWSCGFVDDRTIAVGGRQGDHAILRLFDREGHKVRDLEHGQVVLVRSDPIRSLAIARDGRIAGGGADGSVSLWDSSGRRLGPNLRVIKRESAVEWVDFAPDGKTLVAIVLFRPPDQRRLGAIWSSTTSPPVRFDGGSGRVWSLAVGAESIAVASDSGLRFVSKEGVDLIPQVPGRCIGVSRDREGRRFASCWVSGRLVVHDATGHELASESLPGGVVAWAAFAPDGQSLAAGGKDRVLRQLSIHPPQQTLLATYPGHENQIAHVVFTNDGTIGSSSWDHTVRLWRQRPTAPWIWHLGARVQATMALGSDQHILAADWSGGVIAKLGPNGEIARRWRPTDDRSHRLRATAMAGDGRTAAFAYECKRAAGSGEVLGGELALLRATDEEPRRIPLPHPALAVALDADGTRVYYAQGARVLSLPTDDLQVEPNLALDLDRAQVTALAWSPLGPTLWTGHEDGELHAWSSSDPAPATSHRMGGRTGTRRLASVSVSPAGGRIVTTTQENPPRVWRVHSKEPELERELLGHTDAVHGACWSPDGTRLLTWSADGTARTWDASSGACLLTLRGHRADVNGACFLDDHRVLTASADEQVRQWWLEAGALRRVLRDEATRLLPVGYTVAPGAAGSR